MIYVDPHEPSPFYQVAACLVICTTGEKARAILKTAYLPPFIFQEHGRPLYWSDWKLSPDMNYILLKADRLKVRFSCPFTSLK
jgi:hypothetical protein